MFTLADLNKKKNRIFLAVPVWFTLFQLSIFKSSIYHRFFLKRAIANIVLSIIFHSLFHTQMDKNCQCPSCGRYFFFFRWFIFQLLKKLDRKIFQNIDRLFFINFILVRFFCLASLVILSCSLSNGWQTANILFVCDIFTFSVLNV